MMVFKSWRPQTHLSSDSELRHWAWTGKWLPRVMRTSSTVHHPARPSFFITCVWILFFPHLRKVEGILLMASHRNSRVEYSLVLPDVGQRSLITDREETAVSISSRLRCLMLACVNHHHYHYGWCGVGEIHCWTSTYWKLFNGRASHTHTVCLLNPCIMEELLISRSCGLGSRSHQALVESAVQLGRGSKKQTLVHLKIMVPGLLQVAACLTHSVLPLRRSGASSKLWASGPDFQWSEKYGQWVVSFQLCLDEPHQFHDGYKLHQWMSKPYSLLKCWCCVTSALRSAVPGNWISST